MSVTIEAQNLCLFSRRYNTINESSEGSQRATVCVCIAPVLRRPAGGNDGES